MTKPTVKSLLVVLREVLASISEENIDILVVIEDEEDITIVANTCVACMADSLKEYMEGRGVKHIADVGTRTH